LTLGLALCERLAHGLAEKLLALREHFEGLSGGFAEGGLDEGKA
jgi:hypothetical protein